MFTADDEIQRTPAVFLGCPSYDGWISQGTAKALYQYPTEGNFPIHVHHAEGALLARSFNLLWASALNMRQEFRVAMFGMIHADIDPEPYWFDKLAGILAETDADVVSAVVSIKDANGLTSTAVGDPRNPWAAYRRLTMTEVMDLPETFTIEDVLAAPGAMDPDRAGLPAPAGQYLLPNTGLWVARFDRPWVEQAYFQVNDRIARHPADQDTYVVECEPEDWFFGRQLHEMGCKVVCTRAVHVNHHGVGVWGNGAAWGRMKTDEGPCTRNYPLRPVDIKRGKCQRTAEMPLTCVS